MVASLKFKPFLINLQFLVEMLCSSKYVRFCIDNLYYVRLKQNKGNKANYVVYYKLNNSFLSVFKHE